MEAYNYPIMATRHTKLELTMCGYEQTGVPLIAYDGSNIMPAAPSDDLGIYYFIPEVARLFNITLDQAITTFFLGIIAISFIIGLIGCFLWLKNPISRIFALIAMVLLLYRSFILGDVYVISSMLTIAIVPLFLYFIKQERFGLSFILLVSLACVAIGTGHYIRANTGTAVLIFMVGVIGLCPQLNWKRKVLIFAMMTAGILAPFVYFSNLVNQRDSLVAREHPDYEPALTNHLFWHPVYLGLGFIPNKYHIVFLDEFGMEKALSIDPEAIYPSRRYELVLREEIIRLVRDDPWFVTKTLLAKMGVILLRLLQCANIGLIAAVMRRKPFYIEFSFWIALAFGSLFGILVIPWSAYILSFIAISVLYAVTSVDYALEHGIYKDIVTLKDKLAPYLRIRT